MKEAIARLARGFANRLDERSPAAPPSTVPEIVPCEARRAAGSPRLNFLLPSINAEHYFGGIHTAVVLYKALLPHFPRGRIVLTDAAPSASALEQFPDHHLVEIEGDSDARRQVVAFNDRYGRPLPVSDEDVWLATAWWTAFAAQQLCSWQETTYGGKRRIAYLIQDFEPGFYSWSSQSLVAMSTYRPERDAAVFNTGLLAEFFDRTGLQYTDRLVFEPVLNAGLKCALESERDAPSIRRRQILLYGRPSTARNAFELACEALRVWRATYPGAEHWEVLAAGELQRDLAIGGLTIRALGKLGLEEYSRLLRGASVGLSLMVSPHPSYPPLEMAAFGMGTVTNAFLNKDLGGVFPGLKSAQVGTPHGIAALLGEECARAEQRGMMPYPVAPPNHRFCSGGGIEELAPELAGMLLSSTSVVCP